jgi:hypothetical protein
MERARKVPIFFLATVILVTPSVSQRLGVLVTLKSFASKCDQSD